MFARLEFRFFGQQLRPAPHQSVRIRLENRSQSSSRDAFDLKITARPVSDLIAERPKVAGEFVIIDILGKLSGAKKLVIFQRLPAVFHRVKRGVENNAVRVQMRIERA